MTDRDRLIEVFKKIKYAPFPEMTKNINLGNQFTDYALNLIVDELIANGVIVPPCKVGDKIYQLDTAGDIYESEITQIIYDTKGIAFDERAIGKTVFLTKEEAKEKLKELE